MRSQDLVIHQYQYYILVIRLTNDIEIYIKSNKLVLNHGVYLYIGSARGGGGVLSRIARHLSINKKARWHIDHLTTSRFCEITGIFIIRGDDIDYESWLSGVFSEIFKYIPGFGSSDKPMDPSHLFICDAEVNTCLNKVIKVLEENSIDYIWIHNI